MIVKLRIEITDDWRRRLASHFAGKPVKRLATRSDVAEFVDGCLAAACDESLHVMGKDEKQVNTKHLAMHGGNLTIEERNIVERFRKEGKGDSWITGWLIHRRGSGAPRPIIR